MVECQKRDRAPLSSSSSSPLVFSSWAVQHHPSRQDSHSSRPLRGAPPPHPSVLEFCCRFWFAYWGPTKLIFHHCMVPWFWGRKFWCFPIRSFFFWLSEFFFNQVFCFCKIIWWTDGWGGATWHRSEQSSSRVLAPSTPTFRVGGPGGGGGWCVISPRSPGTVISSHLGGLALPPPSPPSTSTRLLLSVFLWLFALHLFFLACILSTLSLSLSLFLSCVEVLGGFGGGGAGKGET